MKGYFRANTTYFPYIQAIATALIIYMMFAAPAAEWWLISLGMYFLTGCLGITITFHRQLTHGSFKFRYKWMEYLFTFFGAIGGTGSSIGWVAVHNEHHKHSDKDGDPHGPHLGLWNVLIPKYDFEMNKWAVRRLITDKFHLVLHNYYYLILLVWLTGLYTIGGINVLVFAGIIPMGIQIWTSVLSNYGNHMWGYRNYETKEDSRNTWWLAAITWGEGWHNNHHAKPGRWNFQHRWWELDPSAWVIKLVKA